MNLLSFVFVQHFGLACGAALLFLVGALLALPISKRGPGILTRLPMMLFRWVRRMLGEDPSIARMCTVIFGFNGAAMFLYMATGIHPAVPAVISLMTGYNIAVILLLSGEVKALDGLRGSSPARWIPGRWLTSLCGLAVLFLELPCFWYSIAMGIRLGLEVTDCQTSYAQGIAIRFHAYVLLILPVLFVSALCESIAIRGMRTPPQRSEVADQGSGPRP
jgi:Stage II sporulation protein M